MKLRHLTICTLICVLTSVCIAQNLNWNITGAGARAEGFGGAFIGVADDATAIVWNPAGLSQLERAEVSVVGRYIVESTEDKNEISGVTVKNTWSHPNFNFASLAVPFQVGSANIVPAVAYQSQLDFYYNFGNDSVAASGGASTVTPGIAIRFGSVLAIGAAANFWLGTAEYTEKMNAATEKLAFSFNGLNFVGGILIDLGGLSTPVPLRLGAVVKSPFTLKSDVDVSFAGPISFPTQKANWEVEMPLMFGFGASFQIGQSFTIASDYEMRMFNDKKMTITSGATSRSISKMSAHDENLNQFRIGGEYLIVMSAGVIPLRGGFRTFPTLFSDYEWDRTNSTYNSKGAVSGIGFSAGTGFISGSFALDFAYSHDQYEQKWIDAGKTDFSYNYNVDRFSGSLIVYF